MKLLFIFTVFLQITLIGKNVLAVFSSVVRREER